MLDNTCWQQVPGAAEADIFPIFRKPSVTCSNACIIRTPGAVAVFDPGSETAQAELIKGTIFDLVDGSPGKASVWLTHCHADHLLSAPELMEHGIRAGIVCHESGAAALARRDGRWLQTDLLGMDAPRVEAARGLIFPRTDKGLPRLSLDLGGVGLELFHTPGHSPDSICFRIGSLLLTGDLPFAADPGIAGIIGWCRRDLMTSLKGVLSILEQGGVTVVLPGHGRPMTPEVAARLMRGALEKAESMPDEVEVLDRGRMRELAERALLLLDEAGVVFATMTGRLLKVAHYLEELGEEETARHLLGVFDDAAVEELLLSFRSLAAMLKGERLRPNLITLKAVQVIERIDRLFAPERLSLLVDSSLLRRTRRLLTDFLNAVFGVRYRFQEEPLDIREAVSGLLKRLKAPPYEDESILKAVGDEATFVRELARRIAWTPLLADVSVDLDPAPVPCVSMEREVFEDMLTAILESLVAAGAKRVILRASPAGHQILLAVRPGDGRDCRDCRMSDARRGYVRTTLRLSGGDFLEDDGSPVLCLPAA